MNKNIVMVWVELQALQVLPCLDIDFRPVMNCFADVLVAFVHSSYSSAESNDSEVSVGTHGEQQNLGRKFSRQEARNKKHNRRTFLT